MTANIYRKLHGQSARRVLSVLMCLVLTLTFSFNSLGQALAVETEFVKGSELAVTETSSDETSNAKGDADSSKKGNTSDSASDENASIAQNELDNDGEGTSNGAGKSETASSSASKPVSLPKKPKGDSKVSPLALYVGDTFVDDSAEGVAVTYKVTATPGNGGSYAVQVGSGASWGGAAIARDWTGAVSIPELVTHEQIKYEVSSIGDYAFASYNPLTLQVSKVNIPDTVTRLGNSAFAGLSTMKSVTIPASVSSVGSNLFACTPAALSGPSELPSILTEVILEGDLSSFPDGMFKGTKLQSINIPSGVTTIGASVFEDTPLQNVNLPDKLNSIGTSAFAGSALKKVVIPSALGTIGSKAFSDCKSLSEVSFDSSTTIAELAAGIFSNCAQLRAFNIPASVKSIESSAFEASGLLSVNIPSDVAYLGSRAFASSGQLAQVNFSAGNKMLNIPNNLFLDCSALGDVTLPKTVRSIGDSAFQGCSSLSTATIPAAVTSLGESAYFDCANLTTLTFMGDASKINNNSINTSVFFLDTNLSKVVYRGKKIARINLPSSLPTYYYTISYYANKAAFEAKDEPTNVFIIKQNSIPQSVSGTNVYEGYFMNAPVDTRWTLEDGFNFTSEMANSFYVYATPGGAQLTVGATFTADTIEGVTVTYTVTGLANEARNTPGTASVGQQGGKAVSANTMGEISIPNQVLGRDALRYSVTQISSYAFQDCKNFTTITIPSSVLGVGPYAFQRCSTLRNVYFEADASKIIDIGIFDGCANIQTVVFGGKKANLAFGSSAPNIYYTVTYYGSLHDQQTGNKLATVQVKQNSVLDTIKSGDIRSGAIPKLDLGYQWVYEKEFAGNVSLKDSCYAYADGVGFQASITVRGNVPEQMPCWFKVLTLDENSKTGTVQVGLGIDGVTAVHTSAKGVPVIPATVRDTDGNTYTVTEVGNNAFGGSTAMTTSIYITSVELPSTINFIGANAFKACSALNNVTIPANVSIMETSAFASCLKLETVRFANGSRLTAISQNAFASCIALKNLTLPQSLKSIGSNSFSACAALTSLSLPATLTSIGDSAFNNCSALTTLSLPVSLSHVGASVFSGCRSIYLITFEGDASKITFGSSAFMPLSSLRSVVFMDKKSSSIASYIGTTTNTKFDPDGNEYGRYFYYYYSIKFFASIDKQKDGQVQSIFQIREDKIPGTDAAPYLKSAYDWHYEDGYSLTARATNSFYAYAGASIAYATVSGLKSEYPYTGEYLTPLPKLTMPDGTVLKLGVDFKLDNSKGVNKDGYVNNRRQGTAAIYLVGINKYAGSKIAVFNITGYAAFKIKPSFAAGSSFVYTGAPIKPKVKVALTFNGATADVAVKAGKDYAVTYSNNVDTNAKRDGARAKVTISGVGDFDYLTPVSMEFDITPYPINKCSVKGTYEVDSVTSQKTDVTISIYNPIAKEGLSEGRDYTVTNRKSMSGSIFSSYITGTGNYYGVVQMSTEVSSGSGGGAGGGNGGGKGLGDGPGSGDGIGTGTVGYGEAAAFSSSSAGGGGGNGGHFAIFNLASIVADQIPLDLPTTDSLMILIIVLVVFLTLISSAVYHIKKFRNSIRC